jgi:hypothetical protein
VIKMIEIARHVDSELTPLKQVGIGGEVHFLTILPGGQMGWVVRPWPDYDSVFQTMLLRLGEERR